MAQDQGILTFAVQIEVHTGHKLPTGIPLRRAWLHTTVEDGSGSRVFEGGALDADGRLVDRAGAPLAAELVGGPVLDHVDRVTVETEVPVYEAVLADTAGEPTWRLMRGAGWAKDNRLLPQGWDAAGAVVQGIEALGVGTDPDFGAGGDVVHYEIDVGATPGPWTVEVRLRFQTLSRPGRRGAVRHRHPRGVGVPRAVEPRRSQR